MRSVVLLSGGLDSATTLYHAKAKGHEVFCLSFDYGQRHRREIKHAKRLAKRTGCSHSTIRIRLPHAESSLLNKKVSLPKGAARRRNIPSTYVPARNIIFLSHALSYAESIGARKIFIGANQIDYSGYPDCRQEFIKRFNAIARHGTKSGLSGRSIKIEAPLINKTKAQIVKMAASYNVPFKDTWSCYKGAETPCGVCDSCVIRSSGFKRAGIEDGPGNKR